MEKFASLPGFSNSPLYIGEVTQQIGQNLFHILVNLSNQTKHLTVQQPHEKNPNILAYTPSCYIDQPGSQVFAVPLMSSPGPKLSSSK